VQQATQRSKSLALMFLLGAFLTGGALGFAADRAVTHSKPYTKQFDRRAMREELAHELGLSDAQRRSLDSILDWRNEQFAQRMKPVNDSLRDSSRVLINNMLDAGQQRRFKIFRDSVAARAAARDSVRRLNETPK
jgi:uncharacterized membrane protein